MSARTPDGANGVRRPRMLIAFPSDRAGLWAPPGVDLDDQVIVRHGDEIRVYDGPEAMAAAFRALDPVAHAQAAKYRDLQARERELSGLLFLARRERLRERRIDVIGGVLLGIILTLMFGAMLAGAGL